MPNKQKFSLLEKFTLSTAALTLASTLALTGLTLYSAQKAQGLETYAQRKHELSNTKIYASFFAASALLLALQGIPLHYMYKRRLDQKLDYSLDEELIKAATEQKDNSMYRINSSLSRSRVTLPKIEQNLNGNQEGYQFNRLRQGQKPNNN